MKKTIQEVKNVTYMQYSMECFYELYQKAENDAERYAVKCEFLEYAEKSGEYLEGLKQYMSLQPEKFEPFMSLIKDCVGTSNVNKAVKAPEPARKQPGCIVMRVNLGDIQQ